MRRRAVVVARISSCLYAVGLVLSCARDQTPLGRGGRTFQRTCATCHGPDGTGRQTLGLIKPPRDLTRAEFHAQVTDEQLREVIRYGKGQMPAFGGLMADEDIRNVIAFIRTLAPRSAAPSPQPTLGTPPAGAGVPKSVAPTSDPAQSAAAGASGAMLAPVTDVREASAR